MAYWSIFQLYWIYCLMYHNADTDFRKIPFLMMFKTMDFLFIPSLSDETLCSLNNLSNRHIYPNKFMFQFTWKM